MWNATPPRAGTWPVYPPPVVPWPGWPVEWNTPNGGDMLGLDALMGKVSVVFGCIDLNSNVLSTMPPYRMQGTTVVPSLPWMANPQPEVYTGWVEFMKQLVMSYWGVGEVFIWSTARYADGTVRNFVMLNPAWVAVEMEGQTRRYWLGETGSLEITDDILHIRYVSWPGVPRGIGPLEALAANLFGVDALEGYQSMLATRGGIPWGILTAPGNLTQDQAVSMRDNFVAARMSSMGAPAVLSGGVTLSPFTITPKDMALLELRQFDETRISTLLGVPPTLMGLPSGDSMLYRNFESIYDYHWRAHLRTHAAKIMEAISHWALPSTQSVELNRDEYVRPNFAERVTAYAALFGLVDEFGRRAMDIDEIREAERLQALDPGEAIDPTTNVGGDQTQATVAAQAQDEATPPPAVAPPAPGGQSQQPSGGTPQ
jgi:HK97 family phage portal protein